MDKPTTQQSPRYKRRPSDEESLTPKNRKRKKSESSSGDENWLRPDKCCKCSQTFSDNQVKWNKHNIEKSIIDEKIVWSKRYGELIEVKGKDSIQFDLQTSEIEMDISSFISIHSLNNALQIMQSIYDDYESKPLYDTIASPYSSENHKKFILVSIKSLVQGDKPACKVCKINREISLISLHVAKHILCQKVSADVCGFCGTNCNSSLALRLSSGSKAKGTYKAQSNCDYAYSFSMACAVKLSVNNPFSNRSVKCELCEKTVVWSYGSNLNYSNKHQGLICPFNVSDEEKALIFKKKD